MTCRFSRRPRCSGASSSSGSSSKPSPSLRHELATPEPMVNVSRVSTRQEAEAVNGSGIRKSESRRQNHLRSVLLTMVAAACMVAIVMVLIGILERRSEYRERFGELGTSVIWLSNEPPGGLWPSDEPRGTRPALEYGFSRRWSFGRSAALAPDHGDTPPAGRPSGPVLGPRVAVAVRDGEADTQEGTRLNAGRYSS